MTEIIVETQINAPADVCFDLIRDRRIQAEPAPVVAGEFALGQTVTFQTSQFGITQRLSVKVVEFERPALFVDKMTDGSFKSFRHIHEFIPANGATLMRDTLVWTSPFGIIGKIVDKLLLERSLRKLVSNRNARLKALAEIANG